ncbi:tRNA (adenosine(37)-N6)-threonylcarbamoyltransferase complex ATPase subunit type 1 TsaE [Bifidobacterium simiarum]
MSGNDMNAYGRNALTIEAPTADDTRTIGERVAGLLRGGDVVLLSGPLGAGKTTFAQGLGAGLGIDEPIVSPTFTIARELKGRFADGTAAHLVHVDAYRLGGNDYAPGEDVVSRLLDELESLGLDEELEDPSDDTVVLMEWGEQMIAALAPERLEIHIDRPITPIEPSAEETDADRELTGDGVRTITLVPVGSDWTRRVSGLQ